MEITCIEICLCEDRKLRGFANITFDDLFVVRGLKIIRGEKRHFIAMPSRRRGDGSVVDVAHPINREFRRKMERMVLAKYWEELRRYRRGERADKDARIVEKMKIRERMGFLKIR